mmetsp:Transcript_41044/g.76336  ORF Transcript_41044/g.76336 Transcript_41044/m.76336 type:complete len:255 (-) Transcript_41044:260-1024(-)
MAHDLTADVLRQLLPAMGTVDVYYMCSTSKCLREGLTSLQTFAVKFNRQLSVEEGSVESLQQALALLPNLRRLSISLAYQVNLQNSICALVRSFCTHHLARVSLDFRRCGLGDIGTAALMRTLGAMPLTCLDLRLSFNRISSKGAKDLSEALQSSLVSVVLDMDINPIGHGATHLLHAVLNADRAHLDVAHCGLDDAIACDFAHELESHAADVTKPQALEIDLRGNRLEDTKARIIKAVACVNATQCKCLVHLD